MEMRRQLNFLLALPTSDDNDEEQEWRSRMCGWRRLYGLRTPGTAVVDFETSAACWEVCCFSWYGSDGVRESWFR